MEPHRGLLPTRWGLGDDASLRSTDAAALVNRGGINAVAGVGGSSPPGTPRANAPGRWSKRTINRSTNCGGSGFTRRMNIAFAPAVRGSVPPMRAVEEDNQSE